MSRRSGQDGHIERKGKVFYVRFWLDVPGQEARAHKSVRLCPVSGPGAMTKPERERRARQIIAASGADSEEHFNGTVAASLGITFRDQAKWWVQHVTTRKRKPVKPATAKSWQNCLTKWLVPRLGDMPLGSVNNAVVKRLVSDMVAAGLSPKSVHNYIQVVKMVVASAVDENGEEIHPRKWNYEFIDLPQIRSQNTPVFSAANVTSIVSLAEGQFRVLYALLAGTGLRIGEALALEIGKHVSTDGSTIFVQQSNWNGSIQFPKTSNSIREIDVDPVLARMLVEYIGKRESGFLFHHNGRPIASQSSILKRSLHPILEKIGQAKAGFHSFRRFRVTWLRKNLAPEDLVRLWVGHANRSVTDGYSRLSDDVAFRKSVVAKIGIGFELPVEALDVVPSVPIKGDEVVVESVA